MRPEKFEYPGQKQTCKTCRESLRYGIHRIRAGLNTDVIHKEISWPRKAESRRVFMAYRVGPEAIRHDQEICKMLAHSTWQKATRDLIFKRIFWRAAECRQTDGKHFSILQSENVKVFHIGRRKKGAPCAAFGSVWKSAYTVSVSIATNWQEYDVKEAWSRCRQRLGTVSG